MNHQIHESLLPLATPVKALKGLAGNPRSGDVAAVARSYEQFGQRKPIVARRNGEIVAGNHQWQAAKRLKWTHLAVVFVDDDDQTAAAYAVADNRLSELGSVNEDAVAALLADISDSSLLAATGYDDSDLQRLLDSTDPFRHDDLPDGTIPAEPSAPAASGSVNISIGKRTLRVSPAEADALLARLDAYTAAKGTPVGFLLDLCG